MATTPTKIAVVIPSHSHVHAHFAYDLASMMALTADVKPKHVNLGIHMNVGTYIHKSRTQLLQAVLENDATHVLWIDSDMRFPADALIRLLMHQQAVVGINYSKRRIPAEFVAIKHIPEGDDDPGAYLYTGPESTGLEEVDALGFGMVLMETEPLRNLPDPHETPWFWYDLLPNGMTMGEDVYFCHHRLRGDLGLRLFVDHDLSWQCSHIGDFEFRCAHAVTQIEELEELKAAMESELVATGEKPQLEVVRS